LRHQKKATSVVLSSLAMAMSVQVTVSQRGSWRNVYVLINRANGISVTAGGEQSSLEPRQ
jgi:hypothetical protein